MSDIFNILGLKKSNSNTNKLSENSSSIINVKSSGNTLKDHFKCKRNYFKNIPQATQSNSKDIKDSTPIESSSNQLTNQSELKLVFSKYGVNYSDKSLSDESHRDDSTPFKDDLSKFMEEFPCDGSKIHEDLLDYCKNGNKIDEDTLIFLKEIEIQNSLLENTNNDEQNERIRGNNEIVHNLNEYQKLLDEDLDVFEKFILNDGLLNKKRPILNEEPIDKPGKLLRLINSSEKTNSLLDQQQTYKRHSTNERKGHSFLSHKKTSLRLTNRTNESIFSSEDEFISLASQSYSQRRIDSDINVMSSLKASKILKFPLYSNGNSSEGFISLASQNILEFQNNVESLREKQHDSNLSQKIGVEREFSSQLSEELVNPKEFLRIETIGMDKSKILENKTDFVEVTNNTNKIILDDSQRKSFHICTNCTLNDKAVTQKSVLKDCNNNNSLENDPIQKISSQSYASKDHILKKKFIHALIQCNEKENFLPSKQDYKLDVQYLKNFIEEKLQDIKQYMYKNKIENSKFFLCV